MCRRVHSGTLGFTQPSLRLQGLFAFVLDHLGARRDLRDHLDSRVFAGTFFVFIRVRVGLLGRA